VFIMYLKDLLRKSFSASKSLQAFVIITIFLSFCLAARLSGQQPSVILFHGIILDSETRQPLYGTHYIIGGRSTGSADVRGMVSFYAHPYDTVRFTCIGYKDALMVITDTLYAKEYTAGIFMTADTLIIPDVVVIPRLGNLRTEMLSKNAVPDQEAVNAVNNIKISTYQGLTGVNKLGDPDSNYELLRNQQRIDAIEKGGIPSSAMVSFSPFTLISMLYFIAKGPPEEPQAPQPYISPREIQQIRAIHDSLIYGRSKK